MSEEAVKNDSTTEEIDLLELAKKLEEGVVRCQMISA